MLFFASVVDNHSGKDLGGCWVNGEDQKSAALIVEKLVRASFPDACFEALLLPVPASTTIDIPAIGRLLSAENVRAHFAKYGGTVDVRVKEDGKLEPLS